MNETSAGPACKAPGACPDAHSAALIAEPITITTSTGKVWTEESCYGCGGHGLVSVYTMGDFDGAGECGTCWGKGYLFRSPGGALAVYPGGPFRG